jgi:hypothetical protein
MTRAKRRKINIENSKKSTGPTSARGREIASMNAMTHGLTAKVLALPGEDPQIVEIQINQFVDYYQPVAPGEMLLVEEAARAAIRLRRYARHEAALLSDQVDNVAVKRDAEEAERLTALCYELSKDPNSTTQRMKRFSLGASYLLDRWNELEAVLDKHGCWPDNAQMNDAVTFLGDFPENLADGRIEGFAVCLYNAVLVPECDPRYMRELLGKSMNPDYRAEYGATPPDRATAFSRLKAIIAGQREELEALVAEHEAREQRELERAREKAVVPEDSAGTRLFMRYHREATSVFHRSYRELEKLREERLEAEFDESETAEEASTEATSRNEANPAVEPTSTCDLQMRYGESKAPVSKPRAASADEPPPEYDEATLRVLGRRPRL